MVGLTLVVKSLGDQSSPDPLPLPAGIVPGAFLASLWPLWLDHKARGYKRVGRGHNDP